jgi:hypothetical protein
MMGVEATVLVVKRLQGRVKGRVIVTTGDGMGDCGFGFAKGESYLIYATRAKDGRWYTDSCAGTQSLVDAHNEILELEGRLPVLKSPEQAPTLELRGKINDAGYNGFIILLRNNLHSRIFYHYPDHFIQVRRNGIWVDYPPNYNLGPRAEIPEESEASLLEEANKRNQETDAAYSPYSGLYVDRLSAVANFVGEPTAKLVWRVGVRYVSERELDAGKRFQDSKHIIWSDPIDAPTQAKQLSFKEAFTPEMHTEK